MLGVESMEFLDHSDYEGAQTIVDLNEPIAPALESSYDFIIDGGTLDNVFNPPQALMNLSRMLKPGGRLLTYNYYANFGATYTNLPHQWYQDYFAINRFAFAQTYFRVFDGSSRRISVYQANLAKRASSRTDDSQFSGHRAHDRHRLGGLCRKGKRFHLGQAAFAGVLQVRQRMAGDGADLRPVRQAPPENAHPEIDRHDADRDAGR